ncbi:NAD(P)H-dependent oxidoreductase [Mariniflexile litorale]|uniref:NAD(P)H-dependent oxidoreductase n=1 Tax=Mariniflexile litorale TaxID=3045158 RepID=A0AAU7EE65_9FLAO|nr:NAD(P)H-dependent oxidoreductase [Mariniflexile sp. KMM 9835]MDQ8212938.1 NAD(P)H-dependent oxidoreductase [Mariniflexile sp. KMM 9835]
MNIIKQLKWRYATKKFDVTKKVSSEKLDILKQAFNLTATSFGLQTIKLIIVESETLRQPLVAHAYNQKQVLEASHLLVICMQEDILDTDVVAYYDNIKSIRNTPETILKPYREDLVNMMETMSISQRHQWSKNQAYIALGNLMTVCAVENIDSCPMEGFSPEAIDKALQLNKMGLKSVLLLPVGYRDETDMFAGFAKVRKSINEAVIEL